MGNSLEDKNALVSNLVEAAAKPIVGAKTYWHKSIYNILRGKKYSCKSDEEYILMLKSDIVYVRKLWNKEMDIIYLWGKNSQIPSTEDINNIISHIEGESETEIVEGKIQFKSGKALSKEDLLFIERYSSIKELNSRIEAMEEDYIYCRIRDYITLNIYQFLCENIEFAIDLLKDNPKETTQRISDLISNYADMCMYLDIEENQI